MSAIMSLSYWGEGKKIIVMWNHYKCGLNSYHLTHNFSTLTLLLFFVLIKPQSSLLSLKWILIFNVTTIFCKTTTPTNYNSQNPQHYMYPPFPTNLNMWYRSPSLSKEPPTSENSQNPSFFMYPPPWTNPNMCYRPLSYNVEPHNNEPESPIDLKLFK